jgi:glyoxylase-like metal-dependent hydrolase (beta-lactamase superfamily II)
MDVRSFTFNPFMTNCYVCHDGAEAVIVDPSCATDAERDHVVRYVGEAGVTVREILLTHAHIDHIFGCAALSEAFGVGVRVHRSEVGLLAAAGEQARLFGVAVDPPPGPTGFLDHGQEIRIGDARWEVLHTPGHSPGSVSFVDRANGFVISGDVLFRDSIGRTDLWQGSLPELMRSIFDRLLPLGDDVVVRPGHGPSTTIGRERRRNPFLVEG